MAVNIQTGLASFGDSVTNVTVSSYTASKTWLRYSMRVDGNDNAWDCQVIARKVDSTTVQFERRGNTGTAYVRWWLIECDDFSVQDIDSAAPLASTTYEDHTISAVTTSRTFVDVSARMSGDRESDTHPRVRLTSSTNVRIELGAGASGDFEYFIQVVQLAAGLNPVVQQLVVDDSTSDEEIAITRVDPLKTLLVASATYDNSGTWANTGLHTVRLNPAGSAVEMVRTSQTGENVDAVVYVVTADIFSVQRRTVTTTGTTGTVKFFPPGSMDRTFFVGGGYYNGGSQYAVSSGGPDSAGFTLTPDGSFSTITAQREVATGTATVEVQMVELRGVFVELDNIATGNAGASVSHTLTDKDHRVVLVFVDDESETQASGVTYDGEAMTQVVASTSTPGAGNASSMWAILDADLPGSAGSYSVVVSGLDAGASVTVVELNNVAQIIPTGNRIDNTETGATNVSTSTATAGPRDSIAVGALGMGDTADTILDPPTGTGTWTRLFSNDASSARYKGAYSKLFNNPGDKDYTETGSSSDWFRSSQTLAIFMAHTMPNVQHFNAPWFGTNS